MKTLFSRIHPTRSTSGLARGLVVWLGLALIIAPFGFNCHSQTDQTAAIHSTPTQPVDDPDQTVRAMASVSTDGAPLTDSKVRITPASMISANQASQMGLNSLLTSNEDSIILKGTRLLALFDNRCRGKNDSPLQFEAEDFEPKQDLSLASLEAQVAQENCLLRIDENRFHQWAPPETLPETPLTTLATVDDPRLGEARQVIFSKALEAWDWFFSDTGITVDVIVAVVDTGVLYTHPDLVDNIYTNAAGKHGYDYVNSDDEPLDDAGHGTHVAGIIGARANNGIGITGIMGSKIKIMAVKVLDATGSGSEANIVNGIRFAADQGAHVINLSVGGKFASPSIRDAMVYAAAKGAVIVVAAGNDGVLMDATANFYSPSGYSNAISGAISVGSVDTATGGRSTFSNYSTNYVWIAGPGSNGILSTYTANAYAVLQGTSMASPAVAGAAALLVGAYRSHAITYVPGDIINLLVESARPVTSLSGLIRNSATLDVEGAAKLFYSRYIMAGNAATENP